MRLNLSSEIVLNKVPLAYYKHIAMKVFCQLPMPKVSTIN